jgi:arsenical pump membrane protein
MAAVRIVLLGLAVAGAVIRPRGLPAWVAPVACSAIAFATGATGGRQAADSLRPLLGALAFLLAAIPLAALLDRAGVFAAAARRFGDGRWLTLGLWFVAAATTALLNLDAAVVLLTPLYVRVARRVGLPAWYLGAQPLVLSFLASSFLGVSNLTNLIAIGRLGLGEGQFLERLGPPSLVATALGYLFYRRWASRRGVRALTGSGGSRTGIDDADRRALALGSLVVVVLLAGFLAGPSIGLQPWEVAVAADLILAVHARRIPWRAVPVGTALVAASLALLAGAAAADLRVGELFSGHGTLGMLQTMGAASLAANFVNNLPAFLVGLPFVTHRPDQLWALLLAVNMGPSLLVTGTLAALLWRDTMAAAGCRTSARDLLGLGARVTLPAAIVAACVLIALAPLYG